MNLQEYKEQIDIWTEEVRDAGITLSDTQVLPVTFWKTFLGLKRKVHNDMYNGKYNARGGQVAMYVQKAIYFANLVREMDKEMFYKQVRLHLSEFEADKLS